MKIIVFAANLLIQLAIAAFGFLVMLLAMNGFSEKQATPGMILYIIVAILSALGLGAASVYTAQKLIEKTSLGSFGAGAIAILIFTVVGAVILIIGFFAAIFTAEALRK
jgi:hypothetical protein